MMLKKVKPLFTILALSSLVLLFLASIMAYEPSELEEVLVQKTEKIKIKVAEPKTEEPPPPPQEVSNEPASLMSTLAPDSFSAPQDFSAGVGFGSGGSGPGIAGGGGFATDSQTLAREKENMNRPPRILSQSSLEYPSEARQKNISGFVLLKILIGTSGVVEKIEVQESQPQGVFDQAAKSAIQKWRFDPGVIKGQIVASWTLQKIKFELN